MGLRTAVRDSRLENNFVEARRRSYWRQGRLSGGGWAAPFVDRLACEKWGPPKIEENLTSLFSRTAVKLSRNMLLLLRREAMARRATSTRADT